MNKELPDVELTLPQRPNKAAMGSVWVGAFSILLSCVILWGHSKNLRNLTR
jgi:hypothetical protein